MTYIFRSLDILELTVIMYECLHVRSALLGSPLELVIIQQQRFGGNMLSTFKRVGVKHIMRGFIPTAVREVTKPVPNIKFDPLNTCSIPI